MKRRIFAVAMAVLMLVSLSLGTVHAQTLTPTVSDNLYAHDYLLYRTYNRPWNWSDTVLSYLVSHSDGSFTRVEGSNEYAVDAADRIVTVETYDSSYRITSQKAISFELPLFGGFYEGSNYYFLVFGQENPNETNGTEVVRIVSYTKQWKRVASASVYGANTSIPFDAGSLRMAEVDGMLYIHTCHEMYVSSDGRNHQANMTFAVRISDMTLTESRHSVSNTGRGYSSHSFNQFIAVDGDDVITLDHGDAHPRSVVLCRYDNCAGNETLSKYVSYIDVLPIMGGTGDNYTGMQLGSLQVTSTHYLVAGTSVAQDETYNPSGTQNVYVAAVPKNDFAEDAVSITWFTEEALNSDTEISNPYLVEISKTKYLLMWTEDDVLHYRFVDNTGKPIGEVFTMNATLSDCEPVYTGEQVVWYVTDNSTPMFFAINISGATHTHSYQSVVKQPDCFDQGYTLHICDCGVRYMDSYVNALGHKWGDWYEYIAPGCETRGEIHADCTRNCGYYTYRYTDPLGHDYANGVCSRCGAKDPNYAALFNVAGVNLALNNDITLYLYLMAENYDASYTMEITKSYADGREVTKTVAAADWENYYGTMYRVGFNGIAAKEMTDEITVTVYDASGNAVSKEFVTTVADAAVLVYKSEANAASFTMMADLLNYGAAAQGNFRYNTDDLANTRLTAEQAAYASARFDMSTVTGKASGTAGAMGATLYLDTNIQHNFIFDAAVVDSTMTAKVSYTNYKGVANSFTIPGSRFVNNGSMITVNVSALTPADVNVPVTVQIVDANGAAVCSLTDSIAWYCVRAQASATNDLFIELMEFATSCYNYFKD